MTRPGESSADQPTQVLIEDEVPRELDGRPTDRTQRAAADLSSAQLLAQERMAVNRHRQGFTWALVALVTLGGGSLIFGAFVLGEEQWSRLERAGSLVVVPLFTLLGTAIGWYYGDRRGGEGR